ncbi:hypothetical protein UF75_5508 [Desulfosporosinus sp. I2]|nr:hypothetical protein UF75_5508 [Desulfosporosinus sp. I2]
MKVNVYTLNSFAKTKEGGNAAGVIMNADSLSEKRNEKKLLQFLDLAKSLLYCNQTWQTLK